MSLFKKLSMVTVMALVTLSFPVAASWSVQEDASQVNFVSVKKKVWSKKAPKNIKTRKTENILKSFFI